MRSMLIAIAVAAVVILVGTTMYRNYLDRANRSGVMRILFTASKFGQNVVPITTSRLQQLLRNDAQFQQIAVVRKAKNLPAWLTKRVVIGEENVVLDAATDATLILVRVNVGDEVSATEVEAIFAAVTRVVQSDAAQSNMNTYVIAKSIFK